MQPEKVDAGWNKKPPSSPQEPPQPPSQSERSPAEKRRSKARENNERERNPFIPKKEDERNFNSSQRRGTSNVQYKDLSLIIDSFFLSNTNP